MAETREGEGEAGADRETGAAGPEERGRVPAPSPEEVPELLGERSDYPFPFGEDRDEGGAGRGEPPEEAPRRRP